MVEPSKPRPQMYLVDEARLIGPAFVSALSDLRCKVIARSELRALLDAGPPKPVVLLVDAEGFEEAEIRAILSDLPDRHCRGWLLPWVQNKSGATEPLERAAERLGLRVLPPLRMTEESLLSAVKAILQVSSRSSIVADALAQSWLELWYQPKIHMQSLLMKGVEALLRVRHPELGVLPPSLLEKNDSRISNFVIHQAISDWKDLYSHYGHVEIAINLPMEFFRDPVAIELISQRLPRDSGFKGLLIEVDSTAITLDLQLAKQVADQLRHHKVAITVDDTGEDWPCLSGLLNFPFVEIKVDRSLIAGCANDSAKKSTCRHIVQMADGYGARAVADGVETWADFFAVRALGFDLVQGFFFGEPMTIERLMQACRSDIVGASAPATAAAGIGLPDTTFQTLSEGEA